ncbi:MAG TPA: HD domain-containing protein [Candidatus Marinimicrobia bacterium]|nr:HD domain-containing protein [Candidatus Neomarinimicrobiota bacterium]
MLKHTMGESEAKALFDKYLHTEYLRRHSRESEVIMRRLARYFGADETFWGIAGLLHDLDMDLIQGDYSRHGITTVQILKDEGYDIPEIFDAILAHTEGLEGSMAARTKDFHYILAAAENITGIITAYVILKPDKKIAGTKVSSINKKFKDRSFAASVNREFINDIEKVGLEKAKFFEMAIGAMSEIADEIGM